MIHSAQALDAPVQNHKFFLILFLSIIGTLVQPDSMLCSFKHFQHSVAAVDAVSSSLRLLRLCTMLCTSLMETNSLINWNLRIQNKLLVWITKFFDQFCFFESKFFIQSPGGNAFFIILTKCRNRNLFSSVQFNKRFF